MQACAEASLDFGFSKSKASYFACVEKTGYHEAAAVCNAKEETRNKALIECTNTYGEIYQRTGNPLFDRQHLDYCKRVYKQSCVDYAAHDNGAACARVMYSCSMFLGDVEIEKPSCTDSDGTDVYGFGIQEDEVGYIEAGKVTTRDRCLNSRTLIEYACDDSRAVAKVVDCVDYLYEGCFDGACRRDKMSFFDEKGKLDNTSNRNTFENKPESPSTSDDEPAAEPKKPYPIIGGIDIGEFSETGDTKIQVFVHNRGEVAGQFLATIVGCTPFTQFPIRMETILNNQTAVISIDVHLSDTGDNQTRECQVLVEEVSDSDVFTVADITLVYETIPESVICESDEQCTLRQRCNTEQGLCVRKNLCQPVYRRESPEKMLDLVFVGDGYEDDGIMVEDIQRMVDIGGNGEPRLFSTPPFNDFQDRINVWMVRAPENFSGSPDEAETANYGADCAFADQTILISRKNFRPYAYPNDGRVYLSLSYYGSQHNDRWGALLLHELGHAFGGLWDEYVEAGVRNRPGEPNCAPSRGDAQRWWGGTPGTDIVSGCSYNMDNFRPTQESIMRDHLTTNEYGPVNAERLTERLNVFR